MTTAGPHEIRIDIENFSGDHAYAKYSMFSVGSEFDNFTLTVSGYSGTAGKNYIYITIFFCL